MKEMQMRKDQLTDAYVTASGPLARRVDYKQAIVRETQHEGKS